MTLQVPRLPNLGVWPPTSQSRVTSPTTSSTVIRHQTSSSPSPAGSTHCLRCSFPRGPRISFRNRFFLGLPRGTRVKGGWHSERGRGSRSEISMSGKFEEYVFSRSQQWGYLAYNH